MFSYILILTECLFCGNLVAEEVAPDFKPILAVGVWWTSSIFMFGFQFNCIAYTYLLFPLCSVKYVPLLNTVKLAFGDP